MSDLHAKYDAELKAILAKGGNTDDLQTVLMYRFFNAIGDTQMATKYEAFMDEYRIAYVKGAT